MPESFPPFAPRDGHLPLEDQALIGDGSTCALVARDGSIPWLCLPNFDSPPMLAGILDAEHGGEFAITPDGLRGGHQRYLDETAIVVTTLAAEGGVVEITDCMPLRSGADLTELVPAARHELLRVVRVLTGEVDLDVRFAPRDHIEVRRLAGAWSVRWAADRDLPLSLWCSHDLRPEPDGAMRGRVRLRAGEQLTVTLHWSGNVRLLDRLDPAALVQRTAQSWRAWLGNVTYEGPQRGTDLRSALTLKMLDHSSTGAIMAAATSSLPEEVGGVRNWDYRYTWVRDAAFSTYALRRIGLRSEADAFLAWTLECAERDGGPSIMYALDGGQPPDEREDPGLSGWRNSRPVRWGNGAAGQVQHDVYGELLDVAYQWAHGGGAVDGELWTTLSSLADQAIDNWRTPDQGIWEIRDTGRRFTYSVGMCSVAVDRALRVADLTGHRPGKGWQHELDTMRAELLDRAWDEKRQTFTEQLADGDDSGDDHGLDASLLALPLRRVIDFDDPRMVATTAAVTEHLSAGDGLLYRYRHDESSDGLPGTEGAFLLCSFWWVDNLTGQGRLDEAHELYESLCARTNHVGLLSEEIDPADGSFLGNLPQAFSHIGIVASGHRLAKAEQRRGNGGGTR
ncbi:glycoside hydrolase family 15 protein [Rhodococcus rhodnii]|nr:glycoside hydrolase family 15 protein [Rhodococcus rhodnii]TXG91210.1 glycoside hydrolase family 15 protein [Rhodococcus rhodnii]